MVKGATSLSPMEVQVKPYSVLSVARLKRVKKNTGSSQALIRLYLNGGLISTNMVVNMAMWKTAFGRVQPLPDINEGDFRKKSKDERKSVNGPVQGTSADITKLAMSLIYKEVKKRGWFDKLKMILTVHDEIVFEIHEDVIGEAIPVLTNLMSRNKGIANQGWAVPLLVDVEIGKTWGVPYDLKDLKRGYKEKLVPDGVDENGKKKYKEIKVPVPESLGRIFYEQGSEEQAPKEEIKSEPAKPTYTISELTKEEARNVALWLVENEGGIVQYNGKDVSALFI